MGRSLDPGVVGRRLVVGSDLAGRSLGLHSHTAEAHTQEEARNRGVARILGLHSPAEGHKSHNLVAAGSRRKQAVAAHSPAGDRILEGGTPARVTRASLELGCTDVLRSRLPWLLPCLLSASSLVSVACSRMFSHVLASRGRRRLRLRLRRRCGARP